MTQQKEKLFTEFQAPTRQEWLDKIEVDLKGADFQKRLVWRTNGFPETTGVENQRGLQPAALLSP